MENENLDVFDRAMLFLGQKTFGYKGIEAEFAVIHEGKAAGAADGLMEALEPIGFLTAGTAVMWTAWTLSEKPLNRIKP